MSHITPQSGLAKRRLGTLSLLFFTVSASAPMTVLAGGIAVGYIVTGSLGMPLVFPILALALALFAVGYAAMSRYVSNAGAFYAYLAQGLGRAWGVSASFVALLAYNTINLGLYGLFGAIFWDWMLEKFDVDVSWWVWSFAVLAVVALLGILRVDLNARVLGVLLILEVIAVIVFDVAAIGNPAEELTITGFRPDDLFGAAAAGGAFAFGIACFVGFESGAIYSEEVRDPRRTVARATYGALLITGSLYAVSAWALLMGLGPAGAIDALRE
jgi:amino acid transporter